MVTTTCGTALLVYTTAYTQLAVAGGSDLLPARQLSTVKQTPSRRLAVKPESYTLKASPKP